MARNLSEILGPSIEEALAKKFRLDMAGLGTPEEHLVFAANAYSKAMSEKVAPLKVSKGLAQQVEAAKKLDIDHTLPLAKAATIAVEDGRQKIGKFGRAAEVIVSFEEKIAYETAMR